MNEYMDCFARLRHHALFSQRQNSLKHKVRGPVSISDKKSYHKNLEVERLVVRIIVSHFCRGAFLISERSDNFKHKSRGF